VGAARCHHCLAVRVLDIATVNLFERLDDGIIITSQDDGSGALSIGHRGREIVRKVEVREKL